jgi:regulator of protease activity HflC (stomatin/prohibitin superfamily)
VVELWRDEVKDRNLDEFLSDHSSVLAGIEAAILVRLTQETSGTELQLIKERGIRVLDVSIKDLQIPGDIQAEQLQAWFDGWAGPVRKELDEAVDMVREAGIRGEAKASTMLIERLTHKMSQQLQLDRSLSQRDAIILILEDAAQLCVDVPRLSVLSVQVRTALEQVKGRDSDCVEPGGIQ